MENLDKTIAAAVKKGMKPPTAQQKAKIKRSITAYNALDAAEEEWKHKTGKTELDEWDKIQATYGVVEEYYPEKYRTLPPLEEVKDWSQKKSDKEPRHADASPGHTRQDPGSALDGHVARP